MVAIQVLLGILLLLSGVFIYKLCEDKMYLTRRLKRYESLTSQEEYQLNLEDEIANKYNQVIYLEEQYQTFLRKLNDIRKELDVAEESFEFQCFGFYETKYDFLISTDYETQLNTIKMQQKNLIRSGSAVCCPTNWSILDSEKDGIKFMDGFQKLILTVFNESCDGIISKTRPGKIEQSKSLIEKNSHRLTKSQK